MAVQLLTKLYTSRIILPLWKLILSFLVLQVFTVFLYSKFFERGCFCQGTESLNHAFTSSKWNDRVPIASTDSSISIEIQPYPVRGPFTWSCISEEIQNEYTLGGKIPMELRELHANDPLQAEKQVKKRNYISEFSQRWTTASIQNFVKKVRERKSEFPASTYGSTADSCLHQAMEQHSVKGLSVLVVGSQSPWVEAFCIHYGAASITTVDFNVPEVEDPNLIRPISIADLAKSRETFDVVISYSSLEHDGLGRYGDPLHPNGDLERMKRLKLLVKPGGKMFLAVPSGPDFLYWNAHRVYGPIRLPMLIDGWDELDVFCAGINFKLGDSSQPVRVLTPK